MTNYQFPHKISPDLSPEERRGFKFKPSETRETEIMELKERVEKLEVQLEKEKAPANREKIVKQEIKSYLQELQETTSFVSSPITTRDEAKEVGKFSPSQQVGALISLVFEKGLKEAISVANNLDNPAILDEFHDTLVDNYYNELVERKILKLL